MEARRANNAWVRNQNLNLVLNIIRKAQPVSRAQISRVTGLSRSTVSQIVSYLLKAGVVEETGNGDSTGGRQPILLRIMPEGRLVCAIHVDDEGQVYGRTEDLAGNVFAQIAGFAGGSTQLVPEFLRLTGALVEGRRDRVVAIVLALPGVISSDGCILSAVNPGWKEIWVGPPLAEAFNMPVLTENATGLAAYGEWDAGKGHIPNLVYLRIESAVGAGMITNCQLHNGLRGSAAELGHMVIDINGQLCKCGRRGCLETKVSRRAVYRALLESRGSIPQIDPGVSERTVFEWLVERDQEPGIRALLERTARDVASALVNVLNLLGPHTIVVESTLCSSPAFWAVLEQAVSGEALPFAEGRYQLSRAIHGKDAVMKGAIAYARRYFYERAGFYAGLL